MFCRVEVDPTKWLEVFLRVRNFEQILLSVCVLGSKDVEFFRLLFFNKCCWIKNRCMDNSQDFFSLK